MCKILKIKHVFPDKMIKNCVYTTKIKLIKLIY